MTQLFAAISLLKNKNEQVKSTLNTVSNSNYFIEKYRVINSSSHFVFLSTYSNSFVSPAIQINNDVPVINNSCINNKTEIRDKISYVKNADDFCELNDDQMLFEGYKFFGDTLCGSLKGRFNFILWDDIAKKLHAGIDPFNTHALHYAVIDNTLYVASDAKLLAQILAEASLTLSVNTLAITQWLAGRPDPTMSMYNEISLLPLGHYLTVQNNKTTVKKFWDINPKNKIHYKSNEEYQSHFFELLSNSVVNCLNTENMPGTSDNNEPVFTQMSGGMDSTSITAIANIESKKMALELHTVSHSYKNTESCNEMSNINDMISKLTLQHSHFIELDKFNDISFGELYPTDFDNPGIVLSPKYHEELTLMKKMGSNVLLTGNGGDEVCWGHSASYRSRLYKGELGVVNEVIKACGDLGEPVAKSLVNLFVKPLIPQALGNLVKLAMSKPLTSGLDNETPIWLSETANQLMSEATTTALMVNPYNKTFEPAKFARYHSLKSTSTYNSMRSYQKVANQYGIDVRHPFFDVDVVEFSFAIPEKMLIQGSYPKWLLRQTMQDYLPESVVWNKHKVVFDHHFANLIRSNYTEIRTLLSHTGLQDLGLLNNAVLLSEFDNIMNDENKHLNVDMLYAILTQSWYQTHCI